MNQGIFKMTHLVNHRPGRDTVDATRIGVGVASAPPSFPRRGAAALTKATELLWRVPWLRKPSIVWGYEDLMGRFMVEFGFRNNSKPRFYHYRIGSNMGKYRKTLYIPEG